MISADTRDHEATRQETSPTTTTALKVHSQTIMAAPRPLANLTIRRHSPTTIEYSITDRSLPQSIPGYITLFLADLARLVAATWSVLIAFVILREQWRAWPGTFAGQAGSADSWVGENVSTAVFPPRIFSQHLSSSGITLDALVDTLSLPLSLLPSSVLQISGFPDLHHALVALPAVPAVSSAPPTTPLTMPLLLLLSTGTILYLSTTTTETLLVLHTLGLQISRRTTYLPLFSMLSTRLAQRFALDSGILSSFWSAVATLMTLTHSTRFIPTSQIQDVLIHEAFVGWEVRFYVAVVVAGENGLVVVFERLLPRLDVVECVWRGVREVLWEDSRKGIGGMKDRSSSDQSQEVLDERESTGSLAVKKRNHSKGIR